MQRKTGYLASIDNVPPLIFRFQFNPELLQEKKTFNYREANSFGQWRFDQAQAGTGLVERGSGLMNDAKEIGSLLVGARPLEALEGSPRTFSLDFTLDATVPGPMDGDNHYGGSIEPDLAVLRSFMLPAWDLIDVSKMVAAGFSDVPCFSRPPQCSLVYGALSVTCVMTDLNIKLTAFQDDGSPARAEVSATLKEQTFAFSPLADFLLRHDGIRRSYSRKGFGEDVLAVTPVLSSIFT
ncbi:hypothetical protein [Myxococcus sp. RHSTA-1-4]|uniref:CIS tube protein n=1 Tax=Myxococcus sp. RHSTA-1-4 TaxID=2874601 RepID=UPI001CBD2E62|nr:hypothetical protein [Myxococcus sp. RHSTA-1-4]MBZ4417434.1 hypothetical protein [Myxococcus sp. RHSTA-1-4]